MLGSLYSSISGMKAHQTKLDVVGNNIANVNTTGYKKTSVNFEETMTGAAVLYKSASGSEMPKRRSTKEG